MYDAIIKAGTRTFPVHRKIMSASSAYFRALFTSQGFRTTMQTYSPPTGDPLQVQVVELRDEVPDVIACIVDFAYGRDVDLTEDTVQSIFEAADRLVGQIISNIKAVS